MSKKKEEKTSPLSFNQRNVYRKDTIKCILGGGGRKQEFYFKMGEEVVVDRDMNGLK